MDTHITGKEGGREGAKGWNRRVGGPVCLSLSPNFGNVIVDTEAEVDFRKHRILLHFRLRGWTDNLEREGALGRPFHRQILEYRFMNFNFEKRRNASALDRQQREVPREGDKGELDQE